VTYSYLAQAHVPEGRRHEGEVNVDAVVWVRIGGGGAGRVYQFLIKLAGVNTCVRGHIRRCNYGQSILNGHNGTHGNSTQDRFFGESRRGQEKILVFSHSGWGIR
jgi:hypothetical protein